MAKPETVKEYTKEMILRLKPGDISCAVHERVHAPVSAQEQDESHAAVIADLAISRSELEKEVPAWLDLDRFFAETSKIMGEEWWTALLRRTHPEFLSEGMPIWTTIFWGTKNLPQGISDNNEQFYSLAVTCMNLAAVIGYRPDETEEPPEYPIGLALQGAERQFPGAAADPDDLLERLQQLYPQTDAHLNPDSAFSLLHAADAFQGNNKCAGVHTTLAIFEAYGAELRDPSYQEQFKTAVVK